MSYALIGQKILTLGTRYGKHKIPRFIYHITNKSNYELMLKDGVIKTSKDKLFGDGVFTIELINLFKRWGKNKFWGGRSLWEELIYQVAKGSDDLVILRIPTEKLNNDLLRVRSQNILFSWSTSLDCMAATVRAQSEFLKMPRETQGWMDKFFDIFKKYLQPNSFGTHLLEGTPAKDSHLFKQRKEAIEYIYKDAIPIADTVKIGEVNIAQLRSTAEYDPAKPMRSIFIKLLEGTHEVKGAELLNC